MDDKAKSILKRYNQLKSQRSERDNDWQDVVDYMVFRRKDIIGSKSVSRQREDIFDLTSKQANNTLAGGQLAYITPASEQWFAFTSDNKDLDEFFSKATEVTYNLLSQPSTNFYLKMHEALIDRGAFGIMGMMMEETTDGVVFHHLDIGSYVVAENQYGLVDTVIREFELTARNAVAQFGEDNLPKEIKDAAISNPDQVFKFIHSVQPRVKYDPRSKAPKDMPFESCYISCVDNKLLKEGGFRKNPYLISRFNKEGRDPYGSCPGLDALPLQRQCNTIEQDLDILGEKMANPPILAPNDFSFDIDFSAGGITYYDPTDPNSMPKEWQQAGRYDIGLDRLNNKRETIRQLFFVPMIEMFANLDKNMTATEANLRQQEKISQFSPTFTRLTTEFLNPMLENIFDVLLIQGAFGELPADLEGLDYKITYKSKIAIMLQQQGAQNFLQYFQAVSSIAQVDPSVLGEINFPRSSRELAKSFNVPLDYLVTEMEKQEIQQAQAEAQEQQQQQQLSEQALKSAPIAEAVVQQMQL